MAKVRGVQSRGNLHRARIKVNGVQVTSRSFDRIEDAIKARQDMEIKHRGKLDNLPPRELHAMRDTPEYLVRANILDRCLNPNAEDYPNYGGRGITVCKEWEESFLAFYRDMGPRPSPDLTIDRINNDLGYFPDNCEWRTRTEQARNRRMRKDNTSGVAGVSWDKAAGKWRAKIKVANEQIYLGSFDRLEDAAAARKEGEEDHWLKK